VPHHFARQIARILCKRPGYHSWARRLPLVFTAAAFQVRAEALSTAPLTNLEARNYVRMFMSGAHSETPDKQGRVTIPVALRQYASLTRELTVIGAGNHAEIWDAAKWAAFESSQEFNYSSLAQEVIPGII